MLLPELLNCNYSVKGTIKYSCSKSFIFLWDLSWVHSYLVNQLN